MEQDGILLLFHVQVELLALMDTVHLPQSAHQERREIDIVILLMSTDTSNAIQKDQDGLHKQVVAQVIATMVIVKV
jgi:hypothetical protein